MQNFRMFAIAAAAVFVSSPAFSAPVVFHGEATLARAVSAPLDATVSGVSWHCAGDKCVGEAGSYSSLDRQVKECRKVAETVGQLAAYVSRGQVMTKGNLKACNANASAKAGAPATAQK